MFRTLAKQSMGLFIGAVLAWIAAAGVPHVAARWSPAPLKKSAPAVVAAAPVAPVLHYQGRLLDPTTGQPKADGSYSMAFRLYGVATAGSPLWTETKSVAVTKGLFTTLLGDTTALELAQFDGRELYLGVSVGADPEATPRQRIAHVAYALHAENAGHADTAGSANSASNAETLDGLDSTAFAPTVHTHDGAAITTGKVGEPFIDDRDSRDSEVLSIIQSSGGPGSGIDADSIDGYDSASLIKGYSGVQIDQTAALAPGGVEPWFTFGYSPDQLVVWRVRPTTTGGKLKVDVESELGNDGNITYWLTVTNSGSIASTYQLIRTTFYQ